MRSAPLKICVAGAGVFGLVCALELARFGMKVLLVDRDDARQNASAVAAGMLAPFGEALFDSSASAHLPLLAEALDRWPSVAEAAGLALRRQGVVVPQSYSDAAVDLGARISPHPLGVLVAGDGQIDCPQGAMVDLRLAYEDLGGKFEARALSSADLRSHDIVVLAAGPGSRSLIDIAPELSVLEPVKGQIAVLPHGPSDGPVIRWKNGYLAPQSCGARVGATMEPGLDDAVVEPGVIAGLVMAAQKHAPNLDIRDFKGLSGVRMQTPDGLPLVGPSAASGVFVATGARRNGWLFAPLVARMIAAYCMGQDPGGWAKTLHPGRFA